MAKNLQQFPIPPIEDGEDQLAPLEIEPRPRTDFRAAIEEVFTDLGGSTGLATWVKASTANERIFYRDMITKLLPREERKEVTGDGGGPVKYVIEWAGGAKDPAIEYQEAEIVDE